MKDKIELNVTPDGHVEGIYQDGLSEALGANTEHVERASNVEWEDVGEGFKGWVVRAAHDPNLAIRIDSETRQLVVSRKDTDPIFYFNLRDQALEQEVNLFWQLREGAK